MKNRAMLVAILLTILTQFDLHSQERLKKGNYFIGGGIGFSTRDDSWDESNVNIQEYDYTRFSISPYSGKFIKDGIAVGAGLHLSSTDLEREWGTQGDLQITTEDGFRIGGSLFLKKFWPISEKFGAYLSPALGYNRERNEEKTTNGSLVATSKTKSNEISLSARLGIYYFISPRFSFETNLANVVFSKDWETLSTSNEGTKISKDGNRLDLNLINQFSFDQIIVINYYF